MTPRQALKLIKSANHCCVRQNYWNTKNTFHKARDYMITRAVTYLIDVLTTYYSFQFDSPEKYKSNLLRIARKELCAKYFNSKENTAIQQMYTMINLLHSYGFIYNSSVLGISKNSCACTLYRVDILKLCKFLAISDDEEKLHLWYQELAIEGKHRLEEAFAICDKAGINYEEYGNIRRNRRLKSD